MADDMSTQATFRKWRMDKYTDKDLIPEKREAHYAEWQKSREKAASDDAKQIHIRHEAEKIPEGNVKRGRLSK